MASRALIGLAALSLVAAIDGTTTARADVPGVIAESARTAADSVRDGVLTFARTTRAFVFGGTPAAEDTWYDNVEAMRARAQRNADRVRAEAGVASTPAYPEYQDDGGYYGDDGGAYDGGDEHRDEPLPPAVPDDR